MEKFLGDIGFHIENPEEEEDDLDYLYYSNDYYDICSCDRDDNYERWGDD